MSTILRCARLRYTPQWPRYSTRPRHFHQTPSNRSLNLQAPLQTYISSSNDPYLNLSIEHYLLTHSSPASTVLFIYTNRPCIVIGRNQNPWNEVNLRLLRATHSGARDAPAGLERVDVVRRRSGGGAVFHDDGNVNWSITCPAAHFTRDRHAEMVVRALRALGVGTARVNARHDIVLDQGREARGRADASGVEDTHRTPYTADDGTGAPPPLKVSGSAYKLTRQRSLHHATCLLSSPNLGVIPQYLRSPLKGCIVARGVESVSSPVGNIGLDKDEFTNAVRGQFAKMYGNDMHLEDCGEEMLREPFVRKGYEELKSLDWIYGQTPQFSFSSTAEREADAGEKAAPIDHLSLTVRNGTIASVDMKNSTAAGAEGFSRLLEGRKLHAIESWGYPLAVRCEAVGLDAQGAMLNWLVDMLAVV